MSFRKDRTRITFLIQKRPEIAYEDLKGAIASKVAALNAHPLIGEKLLAYDVAVVDPVETKNALLDEVVQKLKGRASKWDVFVTAEAKSAQSLAEMLSVPEFYMIIDNAFSSVYMRDFEFFVGDIGPGMEGVEIQSASKSE
ncbi:hypothetical protein MKEN_01017200 [Mycena kentingensis (nom. inval.)]|nr:hypothetical protein MKEN_01017200 [Mycena kentingensis (nom. inval.)]